MECEIKLSGGNLIDGSGAPARKADVAISNGLISAVGDLDAIEAGSTVDCSGKTVTPGFIDIHSHGDWLLPLPEHGDIMEPFVRQGMTTFVGGNCGFSPAPLSDLNRDMAAENCVLMIDDAVDLAWTTMAEFFDSLERSGVALNVAELVGHGIVRAAVTGPLNMAAPNADELALMERLTKDALDAGCIGVSTGLGYAPGIFAQDRELEAFSGWAAQSGKLFTSHLKAYSWASGVYESDPAEYAHNIKALEEVLEVCKRSGARLQLSHLIFVGKNTWPTYSEVLAIIEKARADGLDVAFDAFPYTAGNTTAAVLFPAPMLPRLEEILSSPEEMAGVRAFADLAFEQIGFTLEDIQIMNANAPSFDRYNGMFVGAAAREAGVDIWEFYARMVIESKRNARVLIHKYSGEGGDEEALRAVLSHPLCTVETDTLLSAHGSQNPASYGTFPRAMSTYVERGLFSVEEAVYKMTGAAAERLGWRDRGTVHEGAAADLTVIDLDLLRDTATFDEPAAFPTGVEHVFINGWHVLDDGNYDASLRAGRLLRS